MSHLPPSIVFAVCAEPFVDGRRAAVFGDATSPLAEELVERGARHVQVCDPVPARAATAASGNRNRQISIASLEDAEAALRSGAYDVVIVPDLQRTGPVDAVLSLAKKALAERGLAFVAAPNPEAKAVLVPHPSGTEAEAPLGYYELYDAVSAHFDEVKMLGQTPFVGYAVVDFAADGEPDVSIDSELVPGGAEEPEWFVACGSTEPAPIEAIQIVQIPARQVVTSEDSKLVDELRAARAAEAHLIDRVAKLEVELAGLAERKSEAPPERLVELEEQLSLRDERIRELTERAATSEALAEEARSEAEVLRAKAEPSADLDALRDRAESAAALEARAATVSREKKELEEQLARKQAQLDELVRVSADKGPEELSALEAQLAERSQQIRKLEADLAEAERIGRELVTELRQRLAAEETAAEPEPLTAENARLRADLEAATWTIQELEGRLSGPS